ncbi:MAG: hypothetical protein WC876_01880 [Candidatus Thermoplasmatota archaeon]
MDFDAIDGTPEPDAPAAPLGLVAPRESSSAPEAAPSFDAIDGTPEDAPAPTQDELLNPTFPPGSSGEYDQTVLSPPPAWTQKAAEAADLGIDYRSPDQRDAQSIMSTLSAPEDANARAEVLRVAKGLNLPRDVVAAKLPEMKASLRAAGMDIEAWRQTSPDLYRLAASSGEAAMVLADEPLSLWQEANNALLDFRNWVDPALESVRPNEEQGVTNARLRKDAREAGRSVPRQTPRLKDVRSETAGTGLERAAKFAYARERESTAQFDVSLAYMDLGDAMVANRLAPGSVDELAIRERIFDLERKAAPAYFEGSGRAEMTAEQVIQGASSTKNVLVEAGPIAAGFAVAGAAVGAVAGAEAGPAGVVAGAKTGGAAGLKFGVEIGVFNGSRRSEGGEALKEALDYQAQVERETGVKQDPMEAVAVANLVGIVAGGAEVMQFGRFTRAFGRGAALRALMGGQRAKSLFLRAGKDMVVSAAGEGGTEMLQYDVHELGKTALAFSATGEWNYTGTWADRLTAGEAGFVGALGLGALQMASNVGVQMHAISEAKKGSRIAASLAGIKDSPTVGAMPGAVAQMVSDATAKHGQRVEALHVDAGAFVRYFQDEQLDPHAAAREMLGPDGPEQLNAAVLAGGKLNVPLEQYLEKWAGGDAAQALAGDTTTRPEHDTANQLAEMAKTVEPEAKALADIYAKENVEPKTPAEVEFKGEVDQLVAAAPDLYSKKDARAALAISWAMKKTMAKAFGVDVAELFKFHKFALEQGRVSPVGAMLQGAEGPAPHSWSQNLTARLLGAKPGEGLDAPTRIDEIHRDDVSGLVHESTWDATPRTPGYSVLVLGTPDLKAVNDHPKAAHDTANEMLRRQALAVGGMDPNAARGGTTIIMEVKGEEGAKEAIARAQAALPPGMFVEFGMGATKREAFTARKKMVDDNRMKKVWPARGLTNFPESGMAGLEALMKEVPGLASSTIDEDLAASADNLPSAEHFRQAYLDKLDPRIFNRLGFLMSGPKPYVMAIDLAGLKRDFNEAFAKFAPPGMDEGWAGNIAIQHFQDAAVATGGNAYAFARYGGDEFAAGGQSEAELEVWRNDLVAELRNNPVRITINGEVRHIRLDFRAAVAKETYGAADRELNRRKRDNPASLARYDAQASKREGGDAGAKLSWSAALQARRARAERRGTHAQAFVNRPGAGVEGRAEGDAGGRGAQAGQQLEESFGPESETPGSAPPIFGAPSAEDIASLRGVIEKMRKKKKQAQYTAYLAFALNPVGEGPVVPAAIVREVARYGIMAPGYEHLLGAAPRQKKRGGKRGPKGRQPAELRAHALASRMDPEEWARAGYKAFEQPAWESVDDIIAEQDRRTEFVDAIKRGAQVPREFKMRRDENGKVLVSRDPSKPGQWRATRFARENGEWVPIGHADAKTFSDAIDRAADDSDLGYSAVERKLYQPGAPGPIWHSAVAKAVTAAKQEKNSPSAWLALISKTPGVKAEEIQWLGLKEWLDQQKGSVARAQVAEFVKAHAIEVVEATGGSANLADVESAYEKASGSWEGLDWGETIGDEDEGPTLYITSGMDIAGMIEQRETLEGEIETLEEKRDEKEVELEEAKKRYGVDGDDADAVGAADESKQALDEELDSLKDDLREKQHELDDLPSRDLLEAGQERLDEVEADAKRAERHGKEAIRLAREDDISGAIGEAESAASLERGYGDDPTWGPLVAALEEAGEGETQYGRHALDGFNAVPGTYSEMRFYAPGTPAKDFTSQHFGDAGKGLLADALVAELALAPDRRANLDDEGERLFFVSEFQSDLHQKGREEGYGDNASVAELKNDVVDAKEQLSQAKLELRNASNDESEVAHDSVRRAEDELAKAQAALDAAAPGVPDAPFKTTWEEMVSKRMLRMAAERGFAKIGWSTGEQAADRYSLAKKVDVLEWIPGDNQLRGRKDGEHVFSETLKSADELPNYVGKDVAKKLLAAPLAEENGIRAPFQSIEGADLSVGGQGMKAAYDQRIPGIFKKLVQKFGGTVQKEKLANPVDELHSEVWTATIPEALRKLVVAEGMPLFQEGDPTNPRGWTSIAQKGLEKMLTVALAEGADLSTHLHESGHVFLELLGDLAERADAPERVKKDWATAREWMGLKPGEAVERKHHEKWARAFEAYLMTGEAPSANLIGAFESFRLWLTDIYKHLRALVADGELNPEIKGVFDRMLATDEEIAAKKQSMGLKQMLTADDFANPADYQRYLDDMERATSHTQRRADLRAMKDRLQAQESWWKEARAKEVDAAEEAYEKLPARQALLGLRGQVWQDGAIVRLIPAVKLDQRIVEVAVGKEAAKKFSTEKGGVKPDELAEQYGYPTGAQMLEAVAKLDDKEAWTERTADDQMTAKHPDVLQDRTALRAEVEKGLTGDATLDWLLTELNVLRSKTGGAPWRMAAVRRAAEIIVGKTVVGRLDAGSALRQERAAADKAAAAAAKGDYAQAAVFKQQQVLNMYLHRELSAAREERAKFEALAGKLDKDKVRARIGKVRTGPGAGEPVLLGGVDSILEALDFAATRDRERDLPGLDAVLAAIVSLGGTEMFEPAVIEAAIARVAQLSPTTAQGNESPRWKELTVTEMREVVRALKNIQGVASTAGTVILGEKRAEKEFVVAELVREARENMASRGAIASSKSAETWSESASGTWNAISGSLLKPEVMADWMGGGDIKSNWFKAIVEPLQRAKALEVDILNRTVKPVLEAFLAMPAKVRSRMNEKVDGAALFPTHAVRGGQSLRPPSKRFEILLVALNAGSDSNLERLLNGRNIDLKQVMAAVDLLTKEELDWVQSVWDAAESLWPEAQALEERDSGIAPPKIERRPLVTKFGTYPGGYFPAVYDRRVEPAGERQAADAVASFMDPSFSRPGTSHSHLKGRAESFSGVISLEPGTIPSHLAQVAHDLAFREAVKSVGSIVLDRDIQATMKDVLGDGRASQFLQWVKDVGQMRGVQGFEHAGALLRAAKTIRANTVVAALGYAIPNAIEDLSNLPASLARTGLKTKHLAAAMAEVAGSPIGAVRFAESKSGELRSRRDQLQRELAAQTKSLTGASALKPLGWLKEHAFVFMEFSDKYSSTPVWLGAYRQALANGASDADAVTKADQTVRQVFPSHSPVDAAAILRDKGFVGTSLMFYGFLSTYYNGIADLRRQFGRADTAVQKGKVAGQLLAYVVAISVLSEFLRGRGREDDEDWAQWFLRKMLSGALSAVPFGGDLGNYLDAKMLGKPTMNPRSVSLPVTFLTLGQALIDAASDEKDADKRVKALIRSAGPFAGIPAVQPIRTLGYISDVAQGNIEPRDPFDFASGLIYGEREGQPQNPLRLMSDAVSGPR